MHRSAQPLEWEMEKKMRMPFTNSRWVYLILSYVNKDRYNQNLHSIIVQIQDKNRKVFIFKTNHFAHQLRIKYESLVHLLMVSIDGYYRDQNKEPPKKITQT